VTGFSDLPSLSDRELGKLQDLLMDADMITGMKEPAIGVLLGEIGADFQRRENLLTATTHSEENQL
jgi:hypothetical protein